MADRLSEDELAERSGISLERIRQIVDLGILQPDDGTFARRDVMRARAVARLDSMGIEADALARALASGDLSLGYLESAGRRHPRSDRTFAEISEDIGVSFTTLERIYLAFGLPRPESDERVREEDRDAIKAIAVLLAAGLDDADVLRMARVWGGGVRRIAEYLPHYFHTSVEARFRRRGLGDNEAYEAAIREVGLHVGRSGEDLLGWLFRRHSEVFMTEHQFEHVETALEDAGVRQRAHRQLQAAVFADLSGYTRLTEQSGDEAAAQISLTLAQLLTDLAARHRGNTVKLLGDGALLHFHDPGDAVRCSLEIVETAPSRGLPPVHIGVNAGPMLYDEGDYFGRTVNVAARIADYARPREVLVSEDVRRAVELEGVSFEEIGEIPLKGIPTPVGLYRAAGG
jgi:adenylate cyclase